MKKVKRIKAVSLGKIFGAMYVIMGLIFGGVVAIFMVLGDTFFASENNTEGIFFGIGAIIILPIIYGLLGFVFGVTSGWLYNVVSKWIGGLEIVLEDDGEV